MYVLFFFFSSRRRHTRYWRDWSSDVCSSDLITLPLIKPALQSALILRTVLAFEVFAVVYALGGRNFPVLVGEAYTWQNQNQSYGVAAAYAVLIMVISLAATLVYLKAVKVDPERLP